MNDKNYFKISHMVLEFGALSEANQCIDIAYSELILCNLIAMGIDQKIVDEKVKPLLQEYAHLCIRHGQSHDYEQAFQEEERKYNELCEMLSEL